MRKEIFLTKSISIAKIKIIKDRASDKVFYFKRARLKRLNKKCSAIDRAYGTLASTSPKFI